MDKICKAKIIKNFNNKQIGQNQINLHKKQFFQIKMELLTILLQLQDQMTLLILFNFYFPHKIKVQK